MKRARDARRADPAGHAATELACRAPAARAPLSERVAFFALVAVLSARGLMPETFEPVELSFLDADTLAGGPTLFSIAVLDLLLLVAATLVLAPARTLATAAPAAVLAAALLIVSVVVSTAAAADQRIAANAGAHLVAMTLAGFALAKLTRHRDLARLALAAVLATGCANAVKCFAQRSTEFGQTLEEWNVRKQQLLDAGYAVDDPLLVNFERRIRSAEAFGFHYHPNIAASSMMMALLAAAGAAAALLVRPGREAAHTGASSAARETAPGRADPRAAPHPPTARDARPSRALPIVVLLGAGATLLAALPLTGSAGALLALLAGAAVFGALLVLRDRVPRLRRRLIVTLVGVYVVVISAGAVWGLARGTLPHSSLAFRWQYWTASIAAYADAPLTGLGRENFADAYLRHKSADAVEEVRNPHNLWLSLLVELGPVGLLAGALLALIAASAALPTSANAATRPGEAATAGSEIELAEATEQTRTRCAPARATIVALIVALAAVHALFGGVALQNPAVAIVWSIELVGVWAFALVGCAWAIGFVEGRTRANVLCFGAFAALAASLVHGLV
ncbi:MAG: O-antigen ligase family protein, partial [Phycisphaerae bacterium]